MSSSPSQRRTQKQPVSNPAQIPAAIASPSPFFVGTQSDFIPAPLPPTLTPASVTSQGSHLNVGQPLRQSTAAGTKRKAMDQFIQPKIETNPALGGADPSAVAGSSTAPPDEPAQPPLKKSRTNTPWTPAEEKRLKAMRDQGSTWSDIAKEFPNRTEGSVKKHWYKDMHYAEFAEDESTALLEAIRDYEANKWKTIGQKVGKPAKACEQYAKEHFQGKI